MSITTKRELAKGQLAYSLPEVMMGVLIFSIMFVTLYLGFTQGFGVVQTSRENLRATQILQQYSELLRLYTWDQLTNGVTLPHPYIRTWAFYPLGGAGNQGITYTGTVSVAASDLAAEYMEDTRKVTLTLNWTSGNIAHERRTATFVARHGLHKYYIPNGP
jgi:hypothetical protein